MILMIEIMILMLMIMTVIMMTILNNDDYCNDSANWNDEDDGFVVITKAIEN